MKGDKPVNGVYLIVSTALIIIGLLGIFLPALPGVALVFLGTVVYAWATGFQVIGWGTLAIFFILTVLAMVADYGASLLAAKKFGASKQGLLGSIIGGIAGLIFFNIPGLIIGQLIGVIVGELFFGKKMQEATKSGFGVFVGYILGSIVKMLIAGLITIIFYFKIIF